MDRMIKRIKIFVLILLFVFAASCGRVETPIAEKETDTNIETSIEKNNNYYSLEDVSEYLKIYGELPPNYITKKEARELGWDNEEGNLWDVSEGAVIGGDRFGNRESLLENKKGRIYYEADVNYEGGYRGPERIVYSNDGSIYYTKDHYESFREVK